MASVQENGTHALASLFTGVAAAHEPETEPLIRMVLDQVSGRIGWEMLADLIRDRDGRLSPVVDVSNVNIFLVGMFVLLAPDARFVLTLRDCYSLLDSLLNHYVDATPAETLEITGGECEWVRSAPGNASEPCVKLRLPHGAYRGRPAVADSRGDR